MARGNNRVGINTKERIGGVLKKDNQAKVIRAVDCVDVQTAAEENRARDSRNFPQTLK